MGRYVVASQLDIIPLTVYQQVVYSQFLAGMSVIDLSPVQEKKLVCLVTRNDSQSDLEKKRLVGGLCLHLPSKFF